MVTRSGWCACLNFQRRVNVCWFGICLRGFCVLREASKHAKQRHKKEQAATKKRNNIQPRSEKHGKAHLLAQQSPAPGRAVAHLTRLASNAKNANR